MCLGQAGLFYLEDEEDEVEAARCKAGATLVQQ